MDLHTKNDHNLIIKAVIENHDNKLIDGLLKHEFDLDHKFVVNLDGTEQCFTAIDKAWENYLHADNEDSKEVSNKIILSLLNANSKFPEKFDFSTASQEVQEFFEKCEQIHELANSKDLRLLKNEIEKVPHLCHIYDEYDESLMMRAMNLRNFEVVDYLSSIGVSIGSHEISKLPEIYESFGDKQLRSIRTKNRQIATENPQIHILVLQSKSKIGRNDRLHANHWKYINEAYKILDQNESCRKVLKVVAACRNVQIYFDFKHGTTYYMDPMSSSGTLGITYESGNISIGAKDLVHDEKKMEVVGVIIHEFCHFAILVTFVNNFDPFAMGESAGRTDFINEVFEECRANQEHEGMVGNVFKSYDPEHFHSELIVLVVQMLMHYYAKNSILSEKMEKFPKLFEYFQNFVEPELDKVLPVLKVLQNPDCSLKFTDLTDPMKAKILYSKINFQGQDTTIFEVIGDEIDKRSLEILNLLSSGKLKNTLNNNKVLEFGEVPKMTAKYGFIERPFIEAKDKFYYRYYRQHDSSFPKNYEKVIEEVKNTKIFVLCGRAGDGKTTTFEFLSQKLKESHKNFWVSLIKLRNFKDIFSKFVDENVNIHNIIEIFCEILNFKTDFEEEIFKNLFFNNKVILLFDGLDEICPKFTDFFFKILKSLKTETQNQIFVSSRHQHMAQLLEIFEISAAEIKPFEDKDRKALQEGVANSRGLTFVDTHNIDDFFSNYSDLNNPLLISIITELYIDKKIDLNLDYYEIFEKMFEAQKGEFDEKIDIIDRDCFHNFSHKKVHQVLALKFIFWDEIIKDLEIVQDWEIEKKNWTAEKIQRFGFVIVDLNFIEKNDKYSIDFIHRTIAEFLVAQFIIESIFDLKRKENVQEIEIIFNLLKYQAQNYSPFNYEFERNFLQSFMQNKLQLQNKKINEKIKFLIIEEIRQVSKKSESAKDFLIFWCPFLHNEQETLRKLFNEKQQKDLIKEFILIENVNFLNYLLTFFRVAFTENWNLVLNNEITYTYKKFQVQKWDHHMIFSENFLKLLDFVEKSFFKVDLEKFIEKYLSVSFLSTLTFNEYKKAPIFQKIIQICLKTESLDLSIFQFFLSNSENYKNLNFVMELIENVEVNREFIYSILFNEEFVKKIKDLIEKGYVDWNVSRWQRLYGAFEFFANYFQKYQKSDELQEILISWKNISKILRIFPEDFHLIFASKMKEIFKSNRLKILDCIDVKSVYDDLNHILLLDIFLINCFDQNEPKLIKKMHEILFHVYNHNHFKNYILDLSNSSDNFSKFLNLFTKYKTSQWKLIKIIQKWEIIPKIFISISPEAFLIFANFLKININSKKSLINKCITKLENSFYNFTDFMKSEEKFNNLVRFWTDFFDGDEKSVKIFIGNVLISNDYYDLMEIAFDDDDVPEFERIKLIFFKYIPINKLQNAMVTNQPIFNGIFRFGKINQLKFDKFLEFTKQIFGENRLKLMEFNNPGHVFWLMSSEHAFSYFEKFLLEFFENDETVVRKFIRKQLLNTSRRTGFTFLNSPLLRDNCEKSFRIIYKKYTNFEEVQNLLISWKNILKIFGFIEYFSTIELRKFLLESFADNKYKIFECIDFNDARYYPKDLCQLFTFEQFLISLVGKNENQVKSCMRKILFRYSSNYNLIFQNANEIFTFELLTYFLIEYKTSDKMLQNRLEKMEIFPEIFKKLTNETYPKFKEFMFKIFETNKFYLRKVFKTLEIKVEDPEYYFENSNSHSLFRGTCSDKDVKNFMDDFEQSIFEGFEWLYQERKLVKGSKN